MTEFMSVQGNSFQHNKLRWSHGNWTCESWFGDNWSRENWSRERKPKRLPCRQILLVGVSLNKPHTTNTALRTHVYAGLTTYHKFRFRLNVYMHFIITWPRARVKGCCQTAALVQMRPGAKTTQVKVCMATSLLVSVAKANRRIGVLQ